MKHNGVAESPKWTRPEDYVEALARQRKSRRASKALPRTQPEAPRLLMSTVPFVAIIAFLAILGFTIMMMAMPRAHPRTEVQRAAAPKQTGVAARGWLQEARKDFHG
jgi:hypothetical protein